MGLRIKELRRAKGLTQTDLAVMAGLDRTQLSKIENEREPANTRRLASIARALGVSVADLFVQDQSNQISLLLALMESLGQSEQEAILAHARALAALNAKTDSKAD